MSDLTKQQFDKWLHEIVAESTDGQRIQRRDCMTVDQECMAFEVWKASRECLVIELPPEPEYPDEPDDAIDDSYMDEYHSSVGMRHACINFIHAAGVQTK